MKDIRMIALSYHDYNRMWDMMETILYATKRQGTTSGKFRNMICDMTEKLYASYLKASDVYIEMRETNPNWLEQAIGTDTESFNAEQSVDSLLSDIEMYATAYSERRKFLEIFNLIMFAAEKEENISPYFILTVKPMQEAMTAFYVDALYMFQEKKEKLAKLGTSPEKHFDGELLQIIKDMNAHDYMAV